MADMPRFGRDTAPLGGIRPEEPEVRRMARQPSIEPRERAARPIFLRHQPGSLVGRQRRGIVDIEVGAPMMAAGTGQRRPREDRLDALRDRQRRCQEHPPRPVEQWTIAAELLIPDEALTIEVTERRGRSEIDARVCSGGVQRQERTRHGSVQQAAWRLELQQMGARSAGEFQRIERAEAGVFKAWHHGRKHTGCTTTCWNSVPQAHRTPKIRR